MKKNVFGAAIAGVAVLLAGCAGDRELYPPSPNEVLTIRTVPAARMFRTEMPGDYFQRDGALFRRLFRYLQNHKLSMTVPVVSTPEEPCSMAFYVSPSEVSRASASRGEVVVMEAPEQLVAVMAYRGNNSRERYAEGGAALKKALQAHPLYEIAGPCYVTYWDAPMWPGFMRHYEITAPVKPRAVESAP